MEEEKMTDSQDSNSNSDAVYDSVDYCNPADFLEIPDHENEAIEKSDSNSNSDAIYDPTELCNPADFLKKPVHKRKALTLKEKADIIAAYDESPMTSKVELARRFKLSRTTLHSIVAKRDSIAESMKKFGSYSSMRKKSRTSPFQEIEGKLLLWMEYAKERNLPVNGFTLRRQAMAIAKELGFEKFTASNGWIERFKSRHNDCWRACKNSGTPAKEEKQDHIPLEPTIEIKEEVADYHPSPSTSSAANEEFILPVEENPWTSPNTSVEPQCNLTVAEHSPPNRPETSDNEQMKKKRKNNDSKTTDRVPLTNGPVVSSLNPVYNFGEFSNPDTSKEHRKDEFDVFGEYIAAKLRNMDRRSCAYAQKAIGDIIFEAEMGKYLSQT